MANLRDKIEYKVIPQTSPNYGDLLLVRMYIYDELLGGVKFVLREPRMEVSVFNVNSIDKAPYFGFNRYNLIDLAEEYLVSLGYNVR